MMTMNNVVERIKEKCKFTKDKEVAKALKISDGALSQHKLRNSIPYKTIIDFAYINGLNLNYILTGHSDDRNNCVQLRYFSDVYASAGYGAINEIEKYENIYVDKTLANELFNFPKNCNQLDIIKIVGDSMEPFIKNGELVVVNRAKNTLDKIKTGEIIIIAIEGEVYCKKLIKQPFSNEIILSSLNYGYSDIKVQLDDFEKTYIIGVVTHTMSVKSFESQIQWLK
ncbi:LexA family transcriptional regulator [Campylobacter sp. RM12637]|uniref:LexA family transcriptional regulator n=1 Tax=Campylobacter sp. RM12637 TaxID=2735734 RepID=UPI00301552C4|nr:LexA family transcriptional regulator [Campylobacter sp. RM12637]